MGVFSDVAGNQLPNQLQTDVNQSLKTKSYFYFLTQPVCIVYRFCARVCPSSWFVSPVDTQIINTVSTARTPLAFSFSFPLFFFLLFLRCFVSVSSCSGLSFLSPLSFVSFSVWIPSIFAFLLSWRRIPSFCYFVSTLQPLSAHCEPEVCVFPLSLALFIALLMLTYLYYFSCLAYLFRFLFGHRLFCLLYTSPSPRD